MTLATPLLSHVIRIEENSVSSVVIENPHLFRTFVQELYDSVEHGSESFILSEAGSRLKLSDSVDVVQTFMPFSLNSKSLNAALLKKVEKLALMPERRVTTADAMANLMRYVEMLLLEIPQEVECEKATVASVLKALGLRFVEDAEDYSNQLLGYLRLVRDFLGVRLNIWINARSYLSDEELSAVLDVADREKISVLLIDCVEKKRLSNEDRLVVDNDLCELSAHDDNLI